MQRIYTIGFTQTTAEQFFGKLREAEVTRLVDVRLQNTSQLAGFAKRGDLSYFAGALLDIEVVEARELAPSGERLRRYREGKLTWQQYADSYERLIDERATREDVFRSIVDRACLLCSEASADRCHRRLIAERFAMQSGAEIVHL